jgi:hypothetical protein
MTNWNSGSCLHHLIAASVCLALVCGFLAVSPACFHWFVMPVYAAGVISAGEVVRWLLGRTNLFSPRGLVAVAAFYSCFLTPLIHVASDTWMTYVIPPEDWRPWLGIMGVLNSIGLLLYKAVFNRRRRRAPGPVDRWTIDNGRFAIVVLVAACVSIFAQGYLLTAFGGYEGMFELFLLSIKTGEDSLAGLGWAAGIGESLPILVVLAYAVAARRRSFLRSWVCLMSMLAAVFLLQILSGGYRGSRGNTVWTMIWAVGIIHFWLRKIPRTMMLVSLVVMCMFMYVGGFYKAAGTQGLGAARDADARRLVEQHSGRTVATLIFGDFDRSDIQAFAVYSQLTYGADYGFGRTYLGSAALLIPQALWPERPPSKIKWTTETEYGQGSYPYVRSSRIYGLMGETMLNFGVWAAPLGFLALGLVVSRVEGLIAGIDASDSRVLMLPLLILVCVLVLMFDTDNVLWVLVKHGGVPFLVITLSSHRFRAHAVARISQRSYPEYAIAQRP